MRMTLDLAPVQSCAVTECAYNAEQRCHARAITVGDGDHPRCDTFFKSPVHADADEGGPGVGACKVSGCRHNVAYECAAELIQVGRHHRHAECMTYAPS